MHYMLVSVYGPCTCGPTTARCVHFTDYSDVLLRRKYYAWRNLSKSLTIRPEAASCFPARLLRYVSTQLDASWSMISRANQNAGAQLSADMARIL